MDQLTLTLIGMVLTPLFTAVALYIGMTKGTERTVDIALQKIEERFGKSATVKRAMKVMEMTDKLFGDDQAVAQITRFFKEARELAEEGKRLASSPEAKNFFVHATKILKDLGAEVEKKDLVTIPEKKES